MDETKPRGEIPYKLITLIVGIVITVLGAYLIGVVISEVVSSIHKTVLIAGLILFAAGIIVLSIMITHWLRRR